MEKTKSFVSILVPSATVFISSACIMILELVAGRLIARHLGSSLYTWTSVIGVVLTGITIGNYIGGRIADRFQTRKTLAVLFGISSLACVLVVITNNVVGEWMFLWYMKWPIRVFVHVTCVFLIPSTLLGMISPVIAKTALDRGLPTGRTVGDIYAWGAAGSIVGTFLAGFYLIAAMGTIAIIWTVGAVLLLMAILYWARLWVLYIWAAVFVGLMTIGMMPVDWARQTGSSLNIRQKTDPSIVYEDETQYCHIMVKRDLINPDRRFFYQDKLLHSELLIGQVNHLQYFYTRIYAAITNKVSTGKNEISALVIGGGGYVYPQYLKETRPASRVDVVEIDAGVTKAAREAFGLSRNTQINSITMDARNYVDELLGKKRQGFVVPKYDFIYEDAINDYTVPYQLVTKEFNDKIFELLEDTGLYMVNLIDIFDSGLFAGTFLNTLEQTFPYVYVITTREPRMARNTFVLIAAKQKIETENLSSEEALKNLDLWILSDSDKNILRKKSQGIILTDDYAPVENMLAPVVRQSGLDSLAEKYSTLATRLKLRGKLEESAATYKELAEIVPTSSSSSYIEIAKIRHQQRRPDETVDAFQKALACNEGFQTKFNIASIHLNLGLLLQEEKKSQEAQKHLLKAIEILKNELIENPGSVKAALELGVALVKTGQVEEGIKYLEQSAAVDWADAESYLELAEAFYLQGKPDLAVSRLAEGIDFMNRKGRKDDAEKLQKSKANFESKIKMLKN